MNLCQFNDFFFPHVKHHKNKRGGLSIYTRDKQIHQSNKAVVCGSVIKKSGLRCILLVVGMKQSLHEGI